MHLFSQKDAVILWNTNSLGKISEFDVFNKKPEEQETPEMRKMSNSLGNCNLGWEKLNEIELTMEVMRIFLTYDFKDPKFKLNCLLKICQIKELTYLREIACRIYDYNLSQKEFEEKIYQHELVTI